LFFASAVFVFLLCAIPAAAQQGVGVRKPSAPVASTISGRVFGITQGGDLKPARFVDVYLLLRAVRENFLFGEGIGQMNAIAAGDNATEERACRLELLAINQALLDSLHWASDNHNEKQVYETQTDEEGNFKIAVPPGSYLVLSSGEAGLSQVFWQQDDVRVLTGGHTELKLHDAKKACSKSAD
jgi:hypothetical protein